MSSPKQARWIALLPILVFLVLYLGMGIIFEYVMGIIPDGMNHSITWHVNLTERHGVKRYPLGTDATLDLICEARASEDERPVVTVKSDVPVTVRVVWRGGEYEIRA